MDIRNSDGMYKWQMGNIQFGPLETGPVRSILPGQTYDSALPLYRLCLKKDGTYVLQCRQYNFLSGTSTFEDVLTHIES